MAIFSGGFKSNLDVEGLHHDHSLLQIKPYACTTNQTKEGDPTQLHAADSRIH